MLGSILYFLFYVLCLLITLASWEFLFEPERFNNLMHFLEEQQRIIEEQKHRLDELIIETESETEEETGETEAAGTEAAETETGETEAAETEPVTEETTGDVPPGTKGGSRYNELSYEERRIYDSLTDKLKNGAVSAEVRLVGAPDKTEIKRAYRAIYFDHPEYFWLRSGYQYSITSGAAMSDLTFDPSTYSYWEYTTDQAGYMERLNSAAESLANEARLQGSTYDQVKYVHDYLCRNVKYDHEAAAENNSTVHLSKNWDYAHTAYGCLVNHLCVCDGYAKGFQLVLQKLGIPCFYTDGESITSKGSGGHAWNFLNIDGDYYQMDVTWDDPDDSVFADFCKYDYFCTTYDKISEEHIVDNDFWVPKSTSVACDYFVHEGSSLDSYDIGNIIQIANNHPGEGLALRFNTPELFSQALYSLMEAGDIAQVVGPGVITYYTGDNTVYVPEQVPRQ